MKRLRINDGGFIVSGEMVVPSQKVETYRAAVPSTSTAAQPAWLST
jgi:hypothetical protein